MVGNHGNTTLNFNLEYPKETLQLGRFGKNNLNLIPAKEPLHHNDLNLNQNIEISITTSFCNEVKENYPFVEIVLIPVAKSGTQFSGYWTKGQEGYSDLVFRTNYVLNNLENAKLKGILWHQGESGFTELEIVNFINDLKYDFGEHFLFISGGFVPYYIVNPNDLVEKQEILQSLTKMYNVSFADSMNPPVQNINISNIHFTKTGLYNMGLRYAQEFINYQNN